MTAYQQRALDLRTASDIHYNCAQAVFIPFAEETGMSTAQAASIAAHFGSGMRMAATCGAVTGGLMALGLLGCSQKASQSFLSRFRQEEGGCDCAGLLGIGKEKGLPKNDHCNAMILHAVELVETCRSL